MKFVKIPPPGTFCHHEAIFEMVKMSGARSFVEIGCGDGSLSKKLCDMGLKGTGLDLSLPAIEIAKVELKEQIDKGVYELIHGDVMDGAQITQPVDLAISIMVMEHIEDDAFFLSQVARLVRPGGHVIVAVPGRRDCWSFEDETVGHFRRYDRADMRKIIRDTGLVERQTWSVGVPTVNLLAGISNFLLKRTVSETKKMQLSKAEQTSTSGIREVPFKTIFPPFFNLILNRFTLSPLFIIQRAFYQTDIGIIVMSLAALPEGKKSVPRASDLQRVRRESAAGIL